MSGHGVGGRNRRRGRRWASAVVAGGLAGAALGGPVGATTVPDADAATAAMDDRCEVLTDATSEVLLWHALASDAETVLIELVDEFNASQGIQVTLVKKPNYELLLDDFVTVPDAELPDVIVGSEISIAALHQGGATVPITACGTGEPGEPERPPLLPVVEATYTIDGDLVAMPFNISTPVLIYNGATVRAAGLDPSDPPVTRDELRAASDAIVASGVASHGLVVYDQVGSWLLRQWAAQRDAVVLEPENGRGSDPATTPRFATPEAIEDFAWLQDGVAAGSFLWIGGTPSGFEDLSRLVPQSDGLMGAYTLHTSGSVGGLIDLVAANYPDAELGVGPLPGPGRGGLVGGGALWLVDTGNPVDVGAAWTAIEWLTRPENLGRLSARTGYIPPSADVAADAAVTDAWAAHPQLRVAYDQLAAMPGTPAAAGALSPDLLILDTLMIEATNRVVDGEDAATVLADVEVFFERFERPGG